MGRKVPLNAYKWKKVPCLPWKVRYLYTIKHHTSQIIKQYFEPKPDASKCQLFLSLLKSRSFAIVVEI